MDSSSKNIIKEAIADAKALKEAAADVAVQKLVEELSPGIKNLVEKTLNESSNEDVDRLRRAADGYGETEFEEGKEVKGADEMEYDEKDLENESLGGMFPGISEMGDDVPVEDELGEAKEEEGDLDDMDEEITIDEESIKRAYESIMKTSAALEEASVSSGFKDSYKSSEWETEESPPSDRGLEKKEKDNSPWEEEKPPAAQDYTVKEAIEKGLRENSDLRRYVSYLEEQVAAAANIIKNLKNEVKEVNLFNQKVVHVNEMFNKFGKKLTGEQKNVVIKKIDKAKNVREVKMVAEALAASFGTSYRINEGSKRRNRADASKRMTSGAPNQKILRESVDKNSSQQFSRLQELAGVKRK